MCYWTFLSYEGARLKPAEIDLGRPGLTCGLRHPEAGKPAPAWEAVQLRELNQALRENGFAGVGGAEGVVGHMELVACTTEVLAQYQRRGQHVHELMAAAECARARESQASPFTLPSSVLPLPSAGTQHPNRPEGGK